MFSSQRAAATLALVPGTPKTKVTLPIGSRESFTSTILKTILCLVLDFLGIETSCYLIVGWGVDFRYQWRSTFSRAHVDVSRRVADGYCDARRSAIAAK